MINFCPDEGKVWFTADHHFGCPNALKYRYRPFKSVDEMNSEMVQLWNTYIMPEDTVYHLGDFAISDEGIKEFAPQLNCKNLFLVIGNHDYERGRNPLLSYFDEIYDVPFELNFNKSYDIYDEGNSLWLAHYPLQRHEILFSVVAHIHNSWLVSKRMLNVGVDANHFLPISLERVLEYRHSEIVGHWDANVYPDADLEWQIEVSSLIKRDESGGEPTMAMLKEKYYEKLAKSRILLEQIKDLRRFLSKEDEKYQYSPYLSLLGQFSDILYLEDDLKLEIEKLDSFMMEKL